MPVLREGGFRRFKAVEFQGLIGKKRRELTKGIRCLLIILNLKKCKSINLHFVINITQENLSKNKTEVIIVYSLYIS